MMVPDSAWARRKFREKDMTIRRLLAYRKVRELQWQLKLERERELETIGNNWKQALQIEFLWQESSEHASSPDLGRP